MSVACQSPCGETSSPVGERIAIARGLAEWHMAQPSPVANTALAPLGVTGPRQAGPGPSVDFLVAGSWGRDA